MRVTSAGHAAFAATMIGLGILGLTRHDFTPVWAPVPRFVPAREVLAYLCAFISLGCGVGLLWQRTADAAARALLCTLLLWLVMFRVPELLRAPAVQDPWSGCGETAVVAAGAWVLYAWFAAERDRRRLGLASGEAGLRIARMLYGAALIPFGTAHFVYIRQTAALVPAWLPWHLGVAWFTGSAFIAAGMAVMTGVGAPLAAVLSAVQMGLFTVLVWLPIVAAGAGSDFQWSETIISWALAVSGWLVAESYRGRRRLDFGRAIAPGSIPKRAKS